MSGPGLAYELYESDGKAEWLMRIGPSEGPPILFVPPLFEEMNRTRALLAAAMRALAARGHCCWLIDLSGTGESERDLADVAWQDWRHDVVAAATHIARIAGKPLVASLRGGMLLDDGADAIGWWRFAPVSGAALTRDMVRSGLAGVEWAGYAPNDGLKAALAEAEPASVDPLRIARLASDAGTADVKLTGPALWRRSEPGASAELAEAMAGDLAAWRQSCAAS